MPKSKNINYEPAKDLFLKYRTAKDAAVKEELRKKLLGDNTRLVWQVMQKEGFYSDNLGAGIYSLLIMVTKPKDL